MIGKNSASAVAALALTSALGFGCGHQSSRVSAVCQGGRGTLYLARHGQTAWNRRHRFQGDPDLDPVGYANRLGLWLLLRDERGLGAVFTSTRLRTKRTAALVARQHGLPILARAELDEIDSGVLEGLCYASVDPAHDTSAEAKACLVEAHGSHPELALRKAREIWSRVRQAGLSGKVPLGESYGDLVRRVRPFVGGELARALCGSGKVLLVGHGVTNRVLLHLLARWPLKDVAALRQGHDQVYRIEGAGGRAPRVVLYKPGAGWRRCSRPHEGQEELDCAQ